MILAMLILTAGANYTPPLRSKNNSGIGKGARETVPANNTTWSSASVARELALTGRKEQPP